MLTNLIGSQAKRGLLKNFKQGSFTCNTLVRAKHASALDKSIISGSSSSSNNGNELFLGSSSGDYITEMYDAWKAEPSSVHLSWRIYFANLEHGRLPAYQPPPNLVSGNLNLPSYTDSGSTISATQLKAEKLAREYRDNGHLKAKLDPLGMQKSRNLPGINLDQLGFTKQELEQNVELGKDLLPGFAKAGVKSMKLGEAISTLEKIYGSSIGVDIKHMSAPEEVQWLQERIETPNAMKFSNAERETALKRLIDADSFERLFATKFTTVKRYGVEGGEAMLPAIQSLVDWAGGNGVSSVVIGMPHRGRLNMYSNMMGQDASEIFAEFSGKAQPPHPWSGDSSYHLSAENTQVTPTGNKVKLSLAANPSHLEAVNPVAMGMTKAKQLSEDPTAMTVLLHGDAAMAGQGVVYESLTFQSLPSYSVNGTVHMVVNNQIGFTTNPHCSRSSRYCCDIAKSIEAPIIHVNGDDIDAVLFATKLAVEWRQKFKKDFFIDLVCYRKNGHNEVDQPSYTQPKMYAKIATQSPIQESYANKLVREKCLTKEALTSYQKKSWARMEDAYQRSQGLSPKSKRWDARPKENIMSSNEVHNSLADPSQTGASLSHLNKVAKTMSALPPGFKVHKNLAKVLQARENMALDGSSIDWATAEQLAFGTLLLEGTPVRISGQDVERGTFSQRHSVIIDQDTEERHTPLNHLSEDQGTFQPTNSHLSEFGVLGYEFGYSITALNSLVLWEAQFGDFSNVAQCMIDQFIASGEQKWLLPSGLTMLLPHGFDGNGPEHSSGRLERYLQLTDEDPHSYPSCIQSMHQKLNWSIVSCSTPANYFHVLRRQVLRPFRKPLICFNGKSILRHPQARSTLTDLGKDGPGFQRGYPEACPEDLVSSESIRTHIICTGQVYYRLLKARQQNKIKDVAISRIEELSPFPFDLVAEYCARYPNAELVWCQEEPSNMGAYPHVLPRLITSLKHNGMTYPEVRYVGRTASAAVAVGNKSRHQQEEFDLISSALYGAPRPMKSITNGIPEF